MPSEETPEMLGIRRAMIAVRSARDEEIYKELFDGFRLTQLGHMLVGSYDKESAFYFSTELINRRQVDKNKKKFTPAELRQINMLNEFISDLYGRGFFIGHVGKATIGVITDGWLNQPKVEKFTVEKRGGLYIVSKEDALVKEGENPRKYRWSGRCFYALEDWPLGGCISDKGKHVTGGLAMMLGNALPFNQDESRTYSIATGPGPRIRVDQISLNSIGKVVK